MANSLIQDTTSGDVYVASLDENGTITAISMALHWSEWSYEDGAILRNLDLDDFETIATDDESPQFAYRVLVAGHNMITTDQAAQWLGVTPRAVRSLATRYTLGTLVTPRLRVFTAAEFERLKTISDGTRGRPKRKP